MPFPGPIAKQGRSLARPGSSPTTARCDLLRQCLHRTHALGYRIMLDGFLLRSFEPETSSELIGRTEVGNVERQAIANEDIDHHTPYICSQPATKARPTGYPRHQEQETIT